MRKWVLGLALASVGASITSGMGASAMAAETQANEAGAKAAELTLARVFGSPDLSGSQPRGLRLSPDGTLLTELRPRADERERLDLWARDTRTGAERMLVDSKKVGTGAALSSSAS